MLPQCCSYICLHPSILDLVLQLAVNVCGESGTAMYGISMPHNVGIISPKQHEQVNKGIRIDVRLCEYLVPLTQRSKPVSPDRTVAFGMQMQTNPKRNRGLRDPVHVSIQSRHRSQRRPLGSGFGSESTRVSRLNNAACAALHVQSVCSCKLVVRTAC